MSSPNPPEWLEERPTAFFISVYRMGRTWRVVVFETGYTMSERLHPHQVAELVIPEDRAALLGTNRELLAEVAAMAIDLADGIPATARV